MQKRGESNVFLIQLILLGYNKYGSNVKTSDSLDIEEIINEIKKIDSSFNVLDYTVKTNMFLEDKKSGIIIFTYMISEDILVERRRFTISSFAVNDLPLPETPKMKQLPLSRNLRLTIIIFFEITLTPWNTPPSC